jgi:hypothetical protein
MAQVGAPVRSQREDVVPWWEELDSELFREFRAATTTEPTTTEPTPPAVPYSLEPESELGRERPVTWAPRAANGRRTVQITGRGTERNLPSVTRSAERNLPTGSPTLRRHERAGFQPDRAAMWAVVLGLLLILVAAASAHAAALPH